MVDWPDNKCPFYWIKIAQRKFVYSICAKNIKQHTNSAFRDVRRKIAPHFIYSPQSEKRFISIRAVWMIRILIFKLFCDIVLRMQTANYRGTASATTCAVMRLMGTGSSSVPHESQRSNIYVIYTTWSDLARTFSCLRLIWWSIHARDYQSVQSSEPIAKWAWEGEWDFGFMLCEIVIARLESGIGLITRSR